MFSLERDLHHDDDNDDVTHNDQRCILVNAREGVIVNRIKMFHPGAKRLVDDWRETPESKSHIVIINNEQPLIDPS